MGRPKLYHSEEERRAARAAYRRRWLNRREGVSDDDSYRRQPKPPRLYKTAKIPTRCYFNVCKHIHPGWDQTTPYHKRPLSGIPEDEREVARYYRLQGIQTPK